MAEVTPVTLLTGLAGAGKTTLLEQLLRQPQTAGIAVIAAPPDLPTWSRPGCLCCAPRDDVARALRTLLPSVRRDDKRRVVIETTGLADPGPILATLLSDTVAASAYRLDTIVTVVNAVTALVSQGLPDKAVRQIAAADRILLTKAERGDDDALRARLRRLNPDAPITIVEHGSIDPAVLLPASVAADDAVQSTRPAAGQQDAAHDDPSGTYPGDADIQAFRLTFDHPLSRRDVTTGLERLVLEHGGALLRIGGIVHLQGEDQPMAVRGVQHLLFPLTALPMEPPGQSHRSRLTFITRGLPRAAVESQFREHAETRAGAA